MFNDKLKQITRSYMQNLKLKQSAFEFGKNVKQDLLYGHKNSILGFNTPFQSALISYSNPTLNRGGSGGWTFEENFSDDQTTLNARWGQAGTLCKPNATNDNFEWTGVRNGTNHAMSADPLGGIISDTAFVLQLKLTMTNLDSQNYTHEFGFGFRSINHTSDSMTSADSLMGAIHVRNPEASENRWVLEGDDATPWASPQMGGNPLTTPRPASGNTKYPRIIRLSATTMSLTIFSDAFITQEQTTGSVAIASTVQNLRYLLFQNDLNTTLTATINGTGDDIKFANGVTVPPT